MTPLLPAFSAAMLNRLYGARQGHWQRGVEAPEGEVRGLQTMRHGPVGPDP